MAILNVNSTRMELNKLKKRLKLLKLIYFLKTKID